MARTDGKRAVLHLGGGFDWRDGRVQRGRAQDEFLIAIQTTAPEVLRSLALTPLDGYRIIGDKLSPREAFAFEQILINDTAWQLHSTELVQLDAALRQWAARWNLTGRWCVARAFLTLQQWFQFIEGTGEDWGLDGEGGGGLLSEDECLFSFTGRVNSIELFFAPFDNQFARLRQEFEVALVDYAAWVNKTMLERGAIPTRTMYERDRFSWFVRYQVLLQSYAAIGKAVSRSPETIRDAVKQVAALLDFRLRPPGKGGRPKGTIETKPRLKP